jgi:O-antigen/teichoic acid export membrane protein
LNVRLSSANGRGEAAYFVIFNVTNVLNYAYLVFVGFLLGAESYGLFGALFGVVYLASSLGNMLRMAVARHVATVRARNAGAVTSEVVTAGVVRAAALSALVGIALVPAMPFLARAFDSATAPAALACLAVVLSIWASASYGVLQGMERFPSLGVSMLVAACGRIAAGVALVGTGAGVSGAIAGVVIGFGASSVLALARAYACTRGRNDGEPWTAVPLPPVRSLAGVLVASAVVAAPTSLDVAVVRHGFSAADSGVFTSVAVLGRVIIFASIAVPYIVLPKVAIRRASGGDTRALLAESLVITGVLAAGAAAAIVFAVDVMGWRLVCTDVSGAGSVLHWYLAAMIAFSLTVTLIYYQVGRGDSSFVLFAGVPWIVLQGLLVALVPASLTEVSEVLFALNAALLAAGILYAMAGVSAVASIRRRAAATIQFQD